MQQYKYSFVVPVYNRPDEVEELLNSIANFEKTDEEIPFEVVIVEDGSTIPCKEIVDKYAENIDIKYYVKENGGCAMARNYGYDKANGEMVIQTDSDCILPPHYLKEMHKKVKEENLDAFGGPDAAHNSFNKLQKATNYAMTSFFTTGGIRTKKQSLSGKRYSPRGCNFGVKKEINDKLGGFSKLRNGEDTEFGIRLYNNNYKVGFIENAFVYHKRRTSLKKFFKQVYWFGRARITLNKLYPDTSKLVFYLPTLFSFFVLFSLILTCICPYSILPLALYILLVFCDSAIKNKSFIIGILSILTSFTQLLGYGIGFFTEFFYRYILRTGPTKGFNI
ncbi:MAG: glycosyltransferase [Bacteroidetes bacterium]|nr:glycosyltransferase [Bacteroidota bacterium]